jgi:hypothetical protein
MPREHKKKNFQIRIPTIHWAYESPYYFQGFSQLASLYASPTQNNNQSRDNATKNNSRIGPGYPISLGGVCVGACCVNFFSQAPSTHGPRWRWPAGQTGQARPRAAFASHLKF